MRNLESVAQKMAELVHQVQKRTFQAGTEAGEAEEHIIISGLYSPNFLVRSSQSLDN